MSPGPGLNRVKDALPVSALVGAEVKLYACRTIDVRFIEFRVQL